MTQWLIPVLIIKSEYQLTSTGVPAMWSDTSMIVNVSKSGNWGEWWCMYANTTPKKGTGSAGHAHLPCHDSSPPLSGPWFHQVVGSRPPQQSKDPVTTCDDLLKWYRSQVSQVLRSRSWASERWNALFFSCNGRDEQWAWAGLASFSTDIWVAR